MSEKDKYIQCPKCEGTGRYQPPHYIPELDEQFENMPCDVCIGLGMVKFNPQENKK